MRWRRRRFKRMRKRARELRVLSIWEKLARITRDAPLSGDVVVWDSFNPTPKTTDGAAS